MINYQEQLLFQKDNFEFDTETKLFVISSLRRPCQYKNSILKKKSIKP